MAGVVNLEVYPKFNGCDLVITGDEVDKMSEEASGTMTRHIVTIIRELVNSQASTAVSRSDSSTRVVVEVRNTSSDTSSVVRIVSAYLSASTMCKVKVKVVTMEETPQKEFEVTRKSFDLISLQKLFNSSIVKVRCKVFETDSILRRFGHCSTISYYNLRKYNSSDEVVLSFSEGHKTLVSLRRYLSDSDDELTTTDELYKRWTSFVLRSEVGRSVECNTSSVVNNKSNEEVVAEMKKADLYTKVLDSVNGVARDVIHYGVELVRFESTSRSAVDTRGNMYYGVERVVIEGVDDNYVRLKVVDNYDENGRSSERMKDLSIMISDLTSKCYSSNITNSVDYAESIQQLKNCMDEYEALHQERLNNRYALEVVDGDR
jgi:hypothetical protein